MASVYTNDLRLEEIGSGEQSGSWGDTTNTNLELIAEAFAFGTEAITTNADTHATTIADGATDPGRALFLKYTGTLDSACTITLGPNTVSKMWFIQNSTSGSQNIIISQGSGANVTIPAGQTKSVYSDGAGSGAAIVDAFATLNVVDLLVDDDLTVTDDMTVGGTLGVTGIATFTDDIIIGDGKTIGSASDVDAITIASNGQVTLTQTLIGTALDISGDIDVDGTTNLDAVDVDGAANFAADVTFAVGADIITASGGTGNLRLGEDAGDAVTGNFNVLVGKDSGTALEGAAGNVGLGYRTLYTSVAGDYNTAIGREALLTSNVSGNNYNTAVGAFAGKLVTTGVDNTIIGGLAGDAITTGGNNTVLGKQALSADTKGGTAVAIGQLALGAQNFTSATDNYNVAVGYSAGVGITTGVQNTIIGGLAGDALTDADKNVAVGRSALTSDTLGSMSTAIGYSALDNQNFTSATNSRNTAVGHTAGLEGTTAVDNTLIGEQAGYYITTGSKNTILGRHTGNAGGVDIRTASNNIVLSDGDGNPRLAYVTTSKSWQLPYNGDTDTGRGGAPKINMSSGATAYDASIQFTDAQAYNAWFGLYNTKAYVMNVSNGVQLSANGTSWASVSDSRLKTVTGRYTNAVADLAQIDPVKFTWNNDESNDPQVGVIAQSVQNVVPEAMDITEQDGTDYLSVRYTELIPLMIASIQEQQATITALTDRITALEGN